MHPVREDFVWKMAVRPGDASGNGPAPGSRTRAALNVQAVESNTEIPIDDPPERASGSDPRFGCFEGHIEHNVKFSVAGKIR
jgi:hypothetical protein